MSLFGEKCIRCGTRTKETYRELPTCNSCREDMEARLQASIEESRPCPVDGASMKKEVAHHVVIDRCPECKGVWLDAGELDRFTEDVATEAVIAMARGITYTG